MLVPISVIVTTRPRQALHHVAERRAALITDRCTVERIGPTDVVVEGRWAVSEPDTYFRSPGCPCCAVREDLVASVVRALRRADPPQRLVVFADPRTDDVLTVIATLLSSFEIARRCSVDAVTLHLDAVELATRLAVGSEPVDPALVPALAIADRIVLDGGERVTDDAAERIRTSTATHAGFGTVLDSGSLVREAAVRLDAWHGAPSAVPIDPGRADRPATVVLRVDDPLDPDAIDEWLDRLVAAHASRILRFQGALSVVDRTERTCCYGVRSFANSHPESEHPVRRSSESVLALCGVGLDADELAAGFLSTVAP